MTTKWKVGLGVAALLAVLVVAGWRYTHYVIRTDRGYVVLQKEYLSFHNSSVDARKWTTADFNAHPLLKSAMVKQGYGDYLDDLRWKEWGQMAANARDCARAWWQRQVQHVQDFWTRLTACRHDREKQPRA